MSTTSWPRYQVSRYEPKGGFTLLGVLVLIVGFTMAGALMGFLAGLVAQWFYIVAVFPVAISGGIGILGVFVALLAKVRTRWLGYLAALLASCTAIFCLHFTLFRATLPESGMLNQAQENTQRSFGEFMDQRAQDGVRLLSTRGGIRQINLGYVGSYVYWFMELFLVAALPVFVAHLMAKEPFCATCNRWKKGQQLGYLDCAPKLAVDALEQGCFARLAACNPTAAEAGLRLSVYVCPGCKDQESVVAYLVQIQKDNNGEKSKEIAFITFPGESLSFFEKLFESTRELL